MGRSQEDEEVFYPRSVEAGGGSDGRTTDPCSDEGRLRADVGNVEGPLDGHVADEDLAGLSVFDLVGVANDLIRGERELSEEELLVSQLPKEIPGVPVLYEDAQTSLEVAYYEKPYHERVIPLCRKKYTQEKALERFAELQEKQGLVLLDAFWTARHWCYRVAVKR